MLVVNLKWVAMLIAPFWFAISRRCAEFMSPPPRDARRRTFMGDNIALPWAVDGNRKAAEPSRQTWAILAMLARRFRHEPAYPYADPPRLTRDSTRGFATQMGGCLAQIRRSHKAGRGGGFLDAALRVVASTATFSLVERRRRPRLLFGDANQLLGRKSQQSGGD